MPSRDEEVSVLISARRFVRTWWLRVGRPTLEENWRYGVMVLAAVIFALAVGAYYGW